MPKMLTLEVLNRRTEVDVRLDTLSAAEGEPMMACFRKIGREEYLGLVPQAPPGSDRWGAIDPKELEGLSDEERRARELRAAEERARRSLEWRASLDPHAREARDAQALDILYRVAARTSLPLLPCPKCKAGRYATRVGPGSLADHLVADHDVKQATAEADALRLKRPELEEAPPQLTLGQIRSLGDDAELAAIAVLRASGLIVARAEEPTDGTKGAETATAAVAEEPATATAECSPTF